MPYSMINIKNVIINPNVDSFIGFLVIAIFFARLFYTDGKKHSAYENWSGVNITVVYLIMLFVYFIPAIFRDSFNSEGKGELFYKVFYYPCLWLQDGVGMDKMLAAIVGMGILLVLSFAMYFIAYTIYVKKHPVILNSRNTVHVDEEPQNENDLWNK